MQTPPPPRRRPRIGIPVRLSSATDPDPRVAEANKLFDYIVELVRDRQRRTPMAPFNGTSPEMTALGRFFRDEGLYTFVRWNYFFTNPPLSITEAELREGFAIIDRALTITDQALA